MTPIEIGTPVPLSVVRDLTKVRDLEYYEGSLLAEFKNRAGDTLVLSWVDTVEVDDHADSDDTIIDDVEGDVVRLTCNRWMAFRVTSRALASYMRRLDSLRNLLFGSRDGFVYLIDVDGVGHFARASLAEISDLPREYIPSDRSYFDASLMPKRDRGAYDILLDGVWDLGDLGAFPKTYNDVYSMTYTFSARRDNKPDVGRIRHDIKKGKGFASNQMYAQLGHAVARTDRPRLDAVHLASPGIISMHLAPSVAAIVAASVIDYDDHRNEIEYLYAQLYRVRHDEAERKGITDRRYASLNDGLMRLLALDADRLRRSTETLDCLADVLLSYCRRLKKLAGYVKDNKVRAL